jgi:hypothetical protein
MSNTRTRSTRTRDAVECRVRIVRNGEELEFEGAAVFVKEMLERFHVTPGSGPATGVRTVVPAEKATPALLAPQRGKELSVGEFVRQLGFRKHTDFVVAFGYYLEKFKGVSEFTAADVNNCYYEAKLESSNTSQMVFQNIKRGYMMEGKSGNKARRAYTLTSSGETFVKNALGDAEK